MNDAILQAYIPSVATLIVVGIGVLYGNSRISDLNINLNRRMDDLNTNLNKRIDDLRSDFSRLESVVVGKLTEVEARLSRIESHLNLH